MPNSPPQIDTNYDDTFDFDGTDFSNGEDNTVDYNFDFTKKLVDALRSPLQHEGLSSNNNNKVRRCPFSGVVASSARGDDDSSSYMGADTDGASTTDHNNSPVLAPSDNWVTGQAAHTCPYMRYQLGLSPLRRTPPPSEGDAAEGSSTVTITTAAQTPTSQDPPASSQVCPYTGKKAAAAATTQDAAVTSVPASGGCPFANQLASIPTAPLTKQGGPCPGVFAATTAAAAASASSKWKDSVHHHNHGGTQPDDEDDLNSHPAVGRNKADIKSLFRRYRESKHSASEITALFNKVTLKTLQRDKKELQHVAVFGTSSVKKSDSSDDGSGTDGASPPATLPGPVASFLSRDLAKPMALAFMKASTNAFCERYYDLHLRMLSDSCGAPKMVTVPSFLLAAPPRRHGAKNEEVSGGTDDVASPTQQQKPHDASETLERELGTKLIATITEAPKRTFLHDILRPLFIERIRQLTRNWTKAVSAVLETRKAQRDGCPMAGRSLEAKLSAVEEKADAITFTLRSFSKQLRLNIMTPEATHEVLEELLHCAHHYLLLVAYYETQVGVPNPGKEVDATTAPPATPCNATRASVYPAGHRFVALMLYSALSDSLRFREHFCRGKDKVSVLRNTLVAELISVQKYMESTIPGMKDVLTNYPGESPERIAISAKIDDFKTELLPWCFPSSLMSLVGSTIEAVALCAVFTAAIGQHTAKILEAKKKQETAASGGGGEGAGGNAPSSKKKSDANNNANPSANPLGTNVSKKSASASSGSGHFSRSHAPPQHHHQPHQYLDSFHRFPFQQVMGATGPTLVTCPVTGATYNVTPVHPPTQNQYLQHGQYPMMMQGGHPPFMVNNGGALPMYQQQQPTHGAESSWSVHSPHPPHYMPMFNQPLPAAPYAHGGGYTPTPTGQF